MVKTCAVCGKSGKNNLNLSFHKFPENRSIRELWIKSLAFKEPVSTHHRICSDHFSYSSYYLLKPGRRILKRCSIPERNLVKNPYGPTLNQSNHLSKVGLIKAVEVKKLVIEEKYEHVKKMFNISPKNKIGLIRVKDIEKLMPEKKIEDLKNVNTKD